MPSLEERIAALEARLAALEARLGSAPAAAAPAPAPAAIPPPAPAAIPVTPQPPAVAELPPVPPIVTGPTTPTGPPPGSAGSAPHGAVSLGLPRFSAALILGWAGAAALVLAAAYLVRLGIEYGWITPTRQVLAAGALGALMTAGGLAVRAADRPYASLLAAGGIAVLYLAVFGAHLYHHLIDAPLAMTFAVAIAALSLSLHAVYRSGVYVAFAMAGSYATPVLVEGQGTVVELAFYLAVWDIVFCAYGLWLGRRIVVVAALYASLIVFDIAWFEMNRPEWRTALVFQLFQFALFVCASVAVAVRTQRGMGAGTAVLQFPALLLFYFFEYALLRAHAPDAAPWAAAGFAVILYIAWGTARAILGAQGEAVADGPVRTPRASLVMIHAFAALVLVQAIYADAIRGSWHPLAALAIASALTFAPRVVPQIRSSRAARTDWWPLYVGAGILVIAGWCELLARWDSNRAVAGFGAGEGSALASPLALLYPAAFYVLYFLRPVGKQHAERALTLAVAHFLLLAGAFLLVDRWMAWASERIEDLWLSIAWGGIAIATLAVALRRRDRLLARSTLGIFLMFGIKVLLVDLAYARPLVRVGILAVLGVSLYAGGWIYRRVLPSS